MTFNLLPHLTNIIATNFNPTQYLSRNSTSLFKHLPPAYFRQLVNMAPTTTKTAAPKAKTTAGVKKKAGKKGKASLAMVQMQAFCEFYTF
jgi:hypothetical protein